jgi:hypothetical protein
MNEFVVACLLCGWVVGWTNVWVGWMGEWMDGCVSG